MKITPLAIDGLFLVEPTKIGDHRGYFSEVFRADKFEAAVGPVRFVQDNQSLSAKKGTIRGLHFQRAPRAQGKLVRCNRGAILDVAVDFRKDSPSFGQHVAVELTDSNWQQLWVPPGFLHGFCTLTDDVEVAYKVTDYYSPEHDACVRWNDPDIGIQWPFAEAEVQLSPKDTTSPLMRDTEPM